MPGWFINTGLLFAHAVAATQRIPPEVGDRTGGQSEALTAVVFSVTALEGFINEFADMASTSANWTATDPRVATLAAIVGELDQSRASLEAKFWFAKWILSGTNYDKGRHPYQDFKLLIDLRNSLIHLKTDRIEDKPPFGTGSASSPACMRGLDARNLTGVFEGNTHTSWVAKISTRAVARWSCDTTAAMGRSILEALPENDVIRQTFASAFNCAAPIAARP
jgi:hypothetical protein